MTQTNPLTEILRGLGEAVTGAVDPKTTRMARLVTESRARAGLPAVDPFDKNAPAGTVRRRIRAHNMLLEIAVPGQDRICGADAGNSNCVLVAGHNPPYYDDAETHHCDPEQRDRAIRFLIHSHPDPRQRA